MVSQIAERENSYQTAFSVLQQQHEGDSSSRLAWFDRLREGAMDRFEQLGFPNVREEEWKYTNVAAIAKTEFVPILRGEAEAELSAELEQSFYPESKHSQLVFQNGIFRRDLSSLDELGESVVAIDLLEAIGSESYGEVVRNHFARGADYNADGFTALNTALASGGIFIQIGKGAQVARPIQLLFYAEPGAQVPVVFPRVLIVAEENSNSTVIESYASRGNRQYFTNAVIEVVVEDGARLEHCKEQRESKESFHIATTTALLRRNSSYDATTFNFGARLSRHNLVVTMEQEGAECWVDGLYVIADEQHTDTHSLIDHRSANCKSHQLYKGILDGKARAVFNGKIFVQPGAQKTDALQTNKNLLLSNEAHVDTKPQLEIFADDVKCAHGAAVGQIDEDELFYLETRGIHPHLARNLLTYGFAEEVIGKIRVESVKSQLDAAVLNRLNTRLEA
jgi:Fe-S cluster assembly protein SufD